MHITTNGSALTPKNCNRLLSAGISSLAVSLESFEPVQFSKLRPGGRLQEVLAGLERFIEARDSESVDVRVNLWMKVMRDAHHQVPMALEYAQRVGVDRVEFQALNPMDTYVRFRLARPRHE